MGRQSRLVPTQKLQDNRLDIRLRLGCDRHPLEVIAHQKALLPDGDVTAWITAAPVVGDVRVLRDRPSGKLRGVRPELMDVRIEQCAPGIARRNAMMVTIDGATQLLDPPVPPDELPAEFPDPGS